MSLDAGGAFAEEFPPDTLKKLVPVYLGVVPKDPFDGNDLKIS